jgi:hypothetical protein
MSISHIFNRLLIPAKKTSVVFVCNGNLTFPTGKRHGRSVKYKMMEAAKIFHYADKELSFRQHGNGFATDLIRKGAGNQ